MSKDNPVDDRIVEMKFDGRAAIEGQLLPFEKLHENALAIPQKDVPVMATLNGKKVQIGTGHIDPQTLIFTTKIDETLPYARIWFERVHGTNEGKHMLAGIMQVSEVTMIADVDTDKPAEDE